MKVKRLDSVPAGKMEMEGALNTYKQIPVGQADGTPAFSFRVFTIQPGGHTPFHRHSFEHINYVIDGKGVIVSEGGSETAVEKGMFALIMPDEMHRYRNTSPDAPLVVICAVPKEYE